MLCLTSARMNMKADILRQSVVNETAPSSGVWVVTHDPDSNEIIRIWQPNDNPYTTVDESAQTLESFDCIARGIMEGGIRVAGTTERFNNLYEGVDYVLIHFPASVRLTRRDRVTNIRDSKGNIIWVEEERIDSAPTIFSVNGVTPILDPFGQHIENMALLERVEIQ